MAEPRTYLDWNATAPLRGEARAAMLAAMDVLGNPSSVHAEGRQALSILSKARDQIAQAFGCDRNGVVFTSGATEAAALMLSGRKLACSGVEHDCVYAHHTSELETDISGQVNASDGDAVALQGANSETGILQALPQGLLLTDQVQSFGKIPVAFNWIGAQSAILSAHKLGGPKGVGALVLAEGQEVTAQLRGGGQEEGRRAGTENLIGIAGFGAAAAAAARDLADGVWQEVRAKRDLLEARILDIAPDAIVIGQQAERLPNTSCFAVAGWKGETQVMQMDLAGFAISAGSACSSGKVKQSRVLTAMGYDQVISSSAVRVSLGPQTSDEEINRFAKAWGAAYGRFRARAA